MSGRAERHGDGTARVAVPEKILDFRTSTEHYWQLAIAGPVATLTMDVDESGGVFSDYSLKLNSYDIGVDNDCRQILATWNKIIKVAAIDYELTIPHRAFLRRIGEFANLHVSVQGEVLSLDEWQTRQDEWLPSDSDLKYLLEQMVDRTPARGEFANWIAPPNTGINGQPIEFEYVKIH